MAPAVHCGVFLTTHHLPLSKQSLRVEQVIKATVSVYSGCSYTQAYFWTAGKARTPDSAVWTQQVQPDPVGGLGALQAT